MSNSDLFNLRSSILLGKLMARKAINFLLRIKNTRSGQINNSHEIGKWISFLASLSNINTIVEIGTWNGRGSSKSIVRGVMSRHKSKRHLVRVFGYEINPVMVQSARRALKKYRFFEVIYGSVVTTQALDRTDLGESEKIWLNQDEAWMKNAPNAYSTIPDSIDLLILDGGEFSTFAEFSLLNNRVSGWIILDDTKTRKCSEILKNIGEDKLFEVIYSSEERHGTAILKRFQN
jgi:hypothetical protein